MHATENHFECPNCGHTETIGGHEQRWHMGDIKCLALGDTDDEYALYECLCGTQAWSKLYTYTQEEIDANE